MLSNDEKAMREFHENYINNRNYSKDDAPPTKEQYAIAKSWVTVGPKNTAKKFKLSESGVQNIVSRVARYQMKYGK